MSCTSARNPVSWGIIQGARWGFKGCWKIDNVKQPLDDYKARMQIRESADSAVLIELTSENNGIAIDTVNKDFYVELTAAQTSSLPVDSTPKRFMFSLELYNDQVSPEVVYTPVYGYLSVDFPEITK